MNKRIRELAEQARDYVADAIELGYPQDQVDDIRDEKFAELIVAECAKICDELQKWPSTEPRHCANDIRIHFGVEE